MAVLGAIATGAFKVGQKVFGFFKKRRAKKAAKREAKAAKLAAKTASDNAKIASLENLLSGGGGGGVSTAIQQGGQDFISNLVAKVQGGERVELPVDETEASFSSLHRGGGGGMNQQTILIAAAAFLAFLFFGRRR